MTVGTCMFCGRTAEGGQCGEPLWESIGGHEPSYSCTDVHECRWRMLALLKELRGQQ